MLHILSRNFTHETVSTEGFSAAVYKGRVSDWPPRFGDRDGWGSVAVTLSDGGPWLKRTRAPHQLYQPNQVSTLFQNLKK